MKISLIADRMNILGGVETHVRDLSLQLVKDRHDVTLITGAEGNVSDPLKDSGVKVLEVPDIIPNIRRPDLYINGVFQTVSALKKVGADIVHSHGLGSELPSRLSSRLLNIPSVHTVHGWSFGHGDGVSVKKIIWGGCHTLAGAFNRGHTAFVSDFNRDHGIKRGYVSSRMSSTVYNGIPDIAVDGVRYKRHCDDSPRVKLVMVSRLSPEKDHSTVLNALSQIKDLDWTIDFAGKGDDSEYVKMANNLGIGDRCHFLGEVSDIPQLLSQKDLLVLATHQEGLPISIIEGMRAKLPIVATNVGGVPEQVKNGENGYTVADSDAEMLADRFRRLITDKESRIVMGAIARRTYEEKFSFDQMMLKTYEIYDHTMEKHKCEWHLPRPSFLRYNAS